jgi:hypothetical protein
VDIGYVGIGLVLVLGVAVVVYGWLADRTDTGRRQDAMTQAPDRTVPGLSSDAPTPAYLTEYELLHKTPHRPSAALTDAERATLQQRLVGAPSLPHGHAAREFTTDEASHLCVLPEPWILVADSDVTTLRELLPFLEKARARDRRVVIVAPSLSRDVLATLQVNAVQQTLRCAAVLMPDAGQRRVLCSLVGADPLPAADLRAGYVPEASLGTCGTWVSSPGQLWVLGEDADGGPS